MKITAGQALVDVLNSWDVKHIYGIPGSSVNGLMDALYTERDKIKYIQVRHESAGAMAATSYSKFSGKIGVCYGSAAPGGTNLFNGLYDAKMDRVPLLAIVGQTAAANVNTNFFQEMDEVPTYSDVAVYNKMATTAEQIPHLIEEAIRTAYSKKGVAVVILPNDLVEKEIDYSPRKEEKTPPIVEKQPIVEDDVNKVLEMIKKAKRPVIYGGLGLAGGRDTVVKISEKFSMPIITTALSIGIAAPNDHENYMGSFGRLGTKPAFEAINKADLMLFVGTNFPFARFWTKDLKIVQINNNIEDIGKQIPVEMGIVADGKEFLEELLKADYKREETDFLKACRINKKNWDTWLENIADDDSKGLNAEAVIKAIRDRSTEDAFYGLDVGNNTMYSVRMLPLNKKRRHVISGWFATLGVGLPYSIAAKLTTPERQVWSISGDGGFAMNMQEIITQVRYELPIINIVLSNGSYGFIQHAQIQKDFMYGVDITDVDWAKTAEGMGAISYTVKNIEELNKAMDEIIEIQKSGNKKPILLDAKLLYSDPLDTSNIKLDPEIYSKEEIEEFKKTYNVFGQPALSEILKEM
ncbi:thiamine pyrophosphate-dependent enzyme [Miniphocaeibacter halophilus]|uniref:Pyruvate oxidase n=1 Tax=Miniphocaeibacter halophilus TaxID=2931922 RepID=A0AC61MMI1_9FIRM|nr:thiamine pyrophosphate-dependent enzyme [Miniphocaeibacter halophilus]QQK06891.1 pyruvate oxidase [Miniphocaeibacter halophilus]